MSVTLWSPGADGTTLNGLTTIWLLPPALWRLAKKMQIPFDFGDGSQETSPEMLVTSGHGYTQLQLGDKLLAVP